jgi:hypothetical protein
MVRNRKNLGIFHDVVDNSRIMADDEKIAGLDEMIFTMIK